jgi:two-component system cell cycle response regulator
MSKPERPEEPRQADRSTRTDLERPTQAHSTEQFPSGQTTLGEDSGRKPGSRLGLRGFEANIILISHPDGESLGMRSRLHPGTELTIGRSDRADLSFPGVDTLSRVHARLTHAGPMVTLEDLGSTNGTYLNDVLVTGAARLASGDRFQAGGVHFKFLHEQDVEHAYHLAIYDLGMKDGLTDIYNRRKYEEEVRREFARARRHRRPLALILFDVDEFKGINDQHGHLTGDRVLQRIVEQVAVLVPEDQILARMGGDEFAILCPETTQDQAHRAAQRLRESLTAVTLEHEGGRFQVTCSFGVAELDPGMQSPADLFQRADRALYHAKAQGRDQVGLPEE